MIYGLRKIGAAAFVATGLTFSLFGAQASALTMSPFACEVTSVQGATACAGIFEGNNSPQNLNGLFGVADWGAESKIDDLAGQVSFAGTTLSVSNENDGDEDVWGLTGVGAYDSLMFVLKGGNSFSAFLMDITTLSGSWDRNSMVTGGANTPVQNRSRGNELSHWSVYVAGNGSPPPSPVPLPAAVWMLLAALGGLGMTRMRKA